jgi:hypothetical protein
MDGGVRRRISKAAMVAGLVGGVMLGASLAASAVTPPAGTVKSENGFEFSDVQGYTPAGSGANCGAYAPGATFGFNVNVYNNSTVGRDQRFNLQVFKMTELSPTTCFTEAQLEAMVHSGQMSSQTQVVNTITNAGISYHFAPGKPLPAAPGASQRVSAATSALTCGYFQFDLGLEATGSFAPAPGFNGPPVSGFVLFNGTECQSTGGTGVSGSTTTTSGSTTTTSQTSAATKTLSNTGGGPVPLAPYAALLVLGLVSLVSGIRLATARGGGPIAHK